MMDGEPTRQFASRSGGGDQGTPLVRAIDNLFSKINFQTEAETLEPENIAKTEAAFLEFLDEMRWPLGKVSFSELMKEKSGDFALRDDGKTPSWYHELSEIMIFLALVKSGKIDEAILDKYGGAEVMISAQLRHDSWEDHGKTPMEIYAELEHDLDEAQRTGAITKEQEYVLQRKAAGVAEIVKLMTRKVPVRADQVLPEKKWPFNLSWVSNIIEKMPLLSRFNFASAPLVDKQGFVLKTNGKRLKVDRFGGDLNQYHEGQIRNPMAAMAKIIDSICGADSRIMPDFLERMHDDSKKFSVADNVKYAKERRAHYSGYPYAKEANDKNPVFADAFLSMDSILGIIVSSLETVNHYFDKNNRDNPYGARPADIDRYVGPAREALSCLPAGWRPDVLMLERLEHVAQQEGENSMAKAILNFALYPAFAPLIGEDRRSQDVLMYQAYMEGRFVYLPDGHHPA